MIVNTQMHNFQTLLIYHFVQLRADEHEPTGFPMPPLIERRLVSSGLQSHLLWPTALQEATNKKHV